MKKYRIFYRNSLQMVLECYTDQEAVDKAKYWYNRSCRDNNKTKSLLSLVDATGRVIKVW